MSLCLRLGRVLGKPGAGAGALAAGMMPIGDMPRNASMTNLPTGGMSPLPPPVNVPFAPGMGPGAPVIDELPGTLLGGAAGGGGAGGGRELQPGF